MSTAFQLDAAPAWPLTFEDVEAARERLSPYLTITPLRHYLLLDALMPGDTSLLVKHENHQPTCSFKVRNGLSVITGMEPEERARGVVAASTGNHGQGIAYAASLLGVRATICVPEGNNPEKNAAMRALGAEVHENGRDFDEAREYVERLAAERGLRYVHSANEPHLIAGVATYALELFEEAPDTEVVLVPIGGGSGACGCALVRTLLGRPAEIIGVQAAGADAVARSWRTGTRVVGDRAATFAEGMATRVTFDLTFGILRELLDDIVTLTEDELEEGVRLALRTTHNLAEGAGAASLAAAVKLRDRLRGKKVVCVMSGGNIDQGTLARILAG